MSKPSRDCIEPGQNAEYLASEEERERSAGFSSHVLIWIPVETCDQGWLFLLRAEEGAGTLPPAQKYLSEPAKNIADMLVFLFFFL